MTYGSMPSRHWKCVAEGCRGEEWHVVPRHHSRFSVTEQIIKAAVSGTYLSLAQQDWVMCRFADFLVVDSF